MVALILETSKVFQTYKYFLIVHILTNFLSEGYVTFMWLPTTHLPYDVYKTSGWLAQLGVSGVVQFMLLAQFCNFTGISILEMFLHRFKVVVIHKSESFLMKLPTYCIHAFRFFSIVFFPSIVWIVVDGKTLIYQQNKKDELFRKFPDLPKDIGCYTVFVVTPEDPVLVFVISLWGITTTLAGVIIISSVYSIDWFLKKAKNLSKDTKKLQRMLIWSLLAQAVIHGAFIMFPIIVQIWQIVIGLSNNDFATILLFCLAYHGFFSTCAMIAFTKQIRQKVGKIFGCCCPKSKVALEQKKTVWSTTFADSVHK